VDAERAGADAPGAPESSEPVPNPASPDAGGGSTESRIGERISERDPRQLQTGPSLPEAGSPTGSDPGSGPGSGAPADAVQRTGPETVDAGTFAPSSPERTDELLATAWGGVLYLLHLLDELELPDAFEDEWGLASTAGPWGCLDLVARGLLAGSFPRIADDPLWRVLAALASWEEADDPRARAPLPPYRLPTAWWPRLDADDHALFWTATRSHLAVASAAGFVLAEVPRAPLPPSEQARVELSRISGLGSDRPLRRRSIRELPLAEAPPLPPGCPAHQGPWLERAVPALRRRLQLALRPAGAPDPADPRDLQDPQSWDPIERLLAIPARLHRTSTHVDLVTDLDAIWLPARAAGLDRDPGWRAELGRVVRFHFT
jgi:hypothetical protein